MRHVSRKLLVVTLLPILITEQGLGAAPVVFRVPDETVTAVYQALRAGDVDAYLNCLSDKAVQETADSFAAMMLPDVSTTAPATGPAPQADSQNDAILKKYGLDHMQRRTGETDDQLLARLASAIKDHRMFLKDVMQLALGDKSNPPRSNAPGKLKDLVIQPNGISASATLSEDDGGGGTLSQPIQFKKIDGSWKIDNAVLF